MLLENLNILFFTRTMELGGTENVVLQLCEIFKPLVNKIIVCSCGGPNTTILDEMGIKHCLIPDIERKNPQTIFSVSKKIKKIVNEENINLIHTHHRMAAFYVSMLKLYQNCLFVNTSHNTFFDRIRLTRYAYSNAKLIACGDMVKKNLEDVYGFSPERISVIRNAVKPFEDSIIVEPLIDELHAQGCFVVGNVGRLSEQKGMEYYIKAIPGVIERCPNARFLVIGSGEDEAKLKQLAEEIHVTEKIHFLGYRKDVQNLMSQMDLIVLSSLWEGLPLTPIEAFSVRRTIVATAVDGTVEIVEDNVNGLLVEPKEIEQLTQQIVFLIENEEIKQRMERSAKDCFINKFSYSRFSEKYIETYQKELNL